MEPVTTEKNSHLQIIITLGLVGVLLAIVGGYIYFGMQQAQQVQIVPVETVVEVVASSTEPAPPTALTSEEREALLADLAKENPVAPAVLSGGEREQILDSLSSSTVREQPALLGEEERKAILDTLPATIPPPPEIPLPVE